MFNKDAETMTRTDVVVDVTPKLEQGNTVVCEIDGGSGSGNKVKGGIIKLKSGAYKLLFTLQPGNYPGLQFAPVGGDAFWCDTNSCPTVSSNNSNNQLSNPQVSVDGLTLTVDADMSMPKAAIFYSLNFNNGKSYDPIIIHD